MIYFYILLSLIASAFFSGMEIAFLSSDKLRLELDRNRGGLSAKILGILYARPDQFITTMLLGNNVALVIYGLLMAILMEPWLRLVFGESDVLILLAQSVLSTLLILFVGEFLPKVTFRANPNRTMHFFSGVLFLIYAVPIRLVHRASDARHPLHRGSAYQECRPSPSALLCRPRVLSHPQLR